MSSRTDQLPDIFPAFGDGCAITSASEAASAGDWFFRLLRLRFRDDDQLVTDLQRGKADALTVLFERHSPLVFRVARRVLRNDADAEDATQQVFIDVFRAVHQFDSGKGTFKSWLLMFAYHRTFNLRRRLRSQCFEDCATDDDTIVPGRVFPAEEGIMVEKALRLIQPRQRRVIELTYYEGLTANEVAALTGESVRVVRHNLYRGLEKLRILLS